MIRVAEALTGLVPAAKPLGIIVAVAVGAWFAGVGFTIGFGETAASIKMVPEIKNTLELHATRIYEVEERLGRAESASDRIVCIVRLNATGELMLASELDRVCPP